MEIDNEEAEEAREAKGRPARLHPIEEELEEHNVVRLPYQSWPPHSAGGKAPHECHRRQAPEEEKMIEPGDNTENWN